MMASLLLLMVVAVAGALALMRWRGKAKEAASRPRALRRAQLVYMEELFRSGVPFKLVARLDRAYRMPDGGLVLVELKTRRIDRVYLSDVIQLSAQKLVLENATAERAQPYAFVTVARPGRPGRWSSHRVALLDETELSLLARRRHAILNGEISPTYAASPGACADCAYRSRCDRPR